MIDFGKVTGFDWDEGNARKSERKHGVTQPEAESVFFNEPLLLVEDRKHSLDEIRFHALGQTSQNRHLHLTFTLRAEDSLIRMISARDMNRKERQIYDEARQNS